MCGGKQRRLRGSQKIGLQVGRGGNSARGHAICMRHASVTSDMKDEHALQFLADGALWQPTMAFAMVHCRLLLHPHQASAAYTRDGSKQGHGALWTARQSNAAAGSLSLSFQVCLSLTSETVHPSSPSPGPSLTGPHQPLPATQP